MRRCRICGCTDMRVCTTPAGPCWWVAEDLCSACEGAAAARRLTPGDPPASWRNPALLGTRITLETTLLRAMAFHGALVLTLTHPGIGGHVRTMCEEMATHLEAMFEELGLEPPAEGWRAVERLPGSPGGVGGGGP